ncbi:NYN domain-containing protein, partial [Mobilicoccus sp.]|uniref:NYN domain-containing protein n=1 Tax=Mobilicoccus sp. TaxID=2034349 RepID=UPI0028A1E666
TDLVQARREWPGASVERVVYCTAQIDQGFNPAGHAEQYAYLQALRAAGSVDHIEFGRYVTGVRARPLAVRADTKRGAPRLVTPEWPIMIQAPLGHETQDAVFMVSTLHQEEKGSDVNVATHLLTDVLTADVDAAVVISNDSDLKLPIARARGHVPVGMVNPSGGNTAGDLRGKPTDGVGGHWWRSLRAPDFTTHQLPDAVGTITKPPQW